MRKYCTLTDILVSGEEYIEVQGARVHNLRNIDVRIPRNKFVVITGVSGSGKSSLAFDTIYAEGQRRYLESFAAYARHFIGGLERPDVDSVQGLSPVIAIEQKTINRNPRSTVGTVTEIYDFLRLLYARAGEAYSYVTGKKMVRYTEEQIVAHLEDHFSGKDIVLLAPVVRGRKGHYRELFEQIRRQGFLRARVDGEIREIRRDMKLGRYKVHDVEIVVDRLPVSAPMRQRLQESLQTALRIGKDAVMVLTREEGQVSHFSKSLMCPDSGISYGEPAPNAFSFNSPYGACPVCRGLGVVYDPDETLMMPDRAKSINEGGIVPLGAFRDNLLSRQIKAAGEKFGFGMDTPLKEISPGGLGFLIHGAEGESLQVPLEYDGKKRDYGLEFEGIAALVRRQYEAGYSEAARRWAEGFMISSPCTDCGGARLKKESLHFKFNGKNISELAGMELGVLSEWLSAADNRLTGRQSLIARDVLKEIRSRLGFLLDVGLEYLSLNLPSHTLSSGESQRIRLATQVGSTLTGVLYVLDEPTIGLHARDNDRLIGTLRQLVDAGNSVVVVEHDKKVMLASDHLLDLGPGAGKHGGQVVAQGSVQEILGKDTLTARYLKGMEQYVMPGGRRRTADRFLELNGARGNNLKNVRARFPLGAFICVTGVSGSGKSSLVNQTLYPIFMKHVYGSRIIPLPYKSVEGLEHIDKVIEIDQSPIGRTPRSNPATYAGFFGDIRSLFAALPDAKVRGYKTGRFSFNVKGGRCETCQGAGMQLVEMNFLPDVHVQCGECFGRRYNRETLEIRYKGKSISDVLDMPVDEAAVFFEHHPALYRKIKALQDVGMGYVSLGQPATTLSGGEAQRVKLASELSRVGTGRTFYILDEPTTGLHFEDVRTLLNILHGLADRGNTVLVIEHNLDVVQSADHIIDLGPEGGRNGGQIVATGTPEQLAASGKGHTARALAKEMTKPASLLHG